MAVFQFVGRPAPGTNNQCKKQNSGSLMTRISATHFSIFLKKAFLEKNFMKGYRATIEFICCLTLNLTVTDN
jgi:hypothetical protein